METAFETINEQLSLGGESNMIWHERPADNWDEALPVGNGRIGGMIFGKPADELIQLNEDSLWSGSFRKRNNPKAYKNLEKMRRLIDEGHTMEAQALCEDAFYGTNEQQRHYQLLGDLHIWTDAADYTDYKRALSLETAVQRTEYTCGGVKYFREMFVSKPDEVMTIKYSCEEKGRVNITSVIDGRDDNYDKNEAYDDNTLLFTVSDGIPYGAAVMIFSEGGKAYTDANRLRAEGCDSVYIVLSCRSAFRSGDYVGEALRDVKKAARMGYDMLKKRHIADYSQLYSRSSVILPDNSEDRCFENTEKRLSYVREGKPDNKLTELYFNFSKYLMIAGSREGTLPLNLQGIWNKDMWPAWGGKYTVNINTEMNYWAAEPQGLGCCVEPLFDHIERMRENGRVTAREMYHCGGAVCHHNTDIWGDCAPQDKWLPATLWPMGLAWLCTHIWEHYKFTQDKTFLAEKFDTLKEACEFFADYLIDDGKGRMVTSPSVSPENTYVTKTGEHGTVCKGPSMDSQILYTLFTALIESAEILDKEVSISGEYAGRDPEFIEKIKRLRSLLPPIEVGMYGQIMEWSED